MNVEIGTEAAQFPEKEYINGIFAEVYVKARLCLVWACKVHATLFGISMAKASWCWRVIGIV